MGKFVTVEYTDDFDGVPIDPKSVDVVSFSYRGQDYELVLTKANGTQFDKDIARYVSAAKKARARAERAARKSAQQQRRQPTNSKSAVERKSKSRKAAAAVTPSAERNRAIRKWANDHGHKVSGRGRIPEAIIDAYDAEH
ncbi:Lsr2 family protein [Mycobacterium palustre]|nr:Lsr2 family protein [Mycobacterium palustre]